MRNRLPTTAIAALVMILSVIPAVASSDQSDPARERGARLVGEPGAADGAPMEDFLGRSSAALGTGASSAQTTAGFDVVVHGGGWGHGIGMSQWGAQAMALAGSSHEQILSHFYTGAQFGAIAPEGSIIQHRDPEEVRVGVGPNRISVSFIPIGGTGELCVLALVEDQEEPDGGDGPPAEEERCFTTEPGHQWFMYGPTATANPGDTCLITMRPTSATPETTMAELKLCNGVLTWDNQPSTRMNFPGIGRTYARGSVRFSHAIELDSKAANFGLPNGRLHVTVAATMDEYLYGLGEVPNSWQMEALKAQVVAARTFALYRIWAVRNNPDGLRPDCACQLMATTVDQAYLGWGTNGTTEGSASGNKWRDAVDQTSGKAMWHTHHGSARAMEAYYFSSTGGATENNEDRWGGNPYPYLRSKPDPGASTWTKGFSYQGFASALGFQNITWVDIPDRYISGRPKSLIVHGTKAGQATSQTFTPAQFTAALGLTSQTVHHIDGFMPEGADRVILHNPNTGLWTLRQANGQNHSFYFGNPGDMAIFGDWNGDGIATVGLYRQSDGYVYLRNSNTTGVADFRFYFGVPGDIPVVGDFDGDGVDTVSIYRPSEQRFYITNRLGNENEAFIAEYSFVYGNPGDIPFAGDWDGDGIDTPGLRRPSDGFVYLRDSNSTGVADISFFYGVGGDIVFSGDWNADGKDGLGIYRPSNGTVYLRNTLSTGSADIVYQFGTSSHRPVAGLY